MHTSHFSFLNRDAIQNAHYLILFFIRQNDFLPDDFGHVAFHSLLVFVGAGARFAFQGIHFGVYTEVAQEQYFIQSVHRVNVGQGRFTDSFEWKSKFLSVLLVIPDLPGFFLPAPHHNRQFSEICHQLGIVLKADKDDGCSFVRHQFVLHLK